MTEPIDKFEVLADAHYSLQDALQSILSHWHGGNSLKTSRLVSAADKMLCEETRRIEPNTPFAVSEEIEPPSTIDEAKAIMQDALNLMEAKNADYGDSWREMRLPSITGQILVKTYRIRRIEESGGSPKVSEGIESEYRDILNYCVFALINTKERREASEVTE